MFLSTRLLRPQLVTSAALALGLVASFACSDDPSNSITAPQLQSGGVIGSAQPDVRAALAAQERHNPRLRAIPGVVGTAVGLNPAGKAVVRVFVAHSGVAGIPDNLDNVPVSLEVTGMLMARSDPTLRARPAPVGFSVGHYAITAGTIGARVLGSGGVYILSNNHVLAYSNDAAPDDPILQPGPFDGGSYPDDQVATLAAFYMIDFFGNPNTMDAAIALTSTSEVGNSTPTDDGYGTPSAFIFDDANADGTFDDIGNALGQGVQKYGRTTKLTKGAITGINGTVTVCYWDFFGICLQEANFVDQLIIDRAGFSDGGDSGSLIVTDDLNRNPVGLLFAGGGTITVGNRIDHVLKFFGVTIDGSMSGGGGGGGGTNSMHVGDLDGTRATQGAKKWKATITIRIHDASEGAVANATVSGTWSGVISGAASCTTGTTGSCAISRTNIPNGSATFTVSNVTHATLQYDAAANHETAITLSR